MKCGWGMRDVSMLSVRYEEREEKFATGRTYLAGEERGYEIAVATVHRGRDKEVPHKGSSRHWRRRWDEH